jgi:hypothetical protein
MMLARILQRYRLALPEDPTPPPRAGFALGLAHGLFGGLSERSA